MAERKETRITDVHVDVGFDDLDRSKLIFTLMANVRDNEGNVIHSYRDDITDAVTPDDIALLAPLIERSLERIMIDRSITVEDIQEGTNHVLDQQERDRAIFEEAEREQREQEQEASRAPLPPMGSRPGPDEEQTMTLEELIAYQDAVGRENQRLEEEARREREAVARAHAEREERERANSPPPIPRSRRNDGDADQIK